MRIISKFHDYYDSVQKFGHDDHCLFVRSAERLEGESLANMAFLRPALSATDETYTGHGAPLKVTPFVIAFCGNLYPGIRLRSPGLPGKLPAFDECHYRFEDYATHLAALGRHLKPARAARRYRSSRWRYHRESPFDHADVTAFFAAERAAHRDALVTGGHSILLATRRPHSDGFDLEMCAALAPWRFYQVLDAYSAYQELEMYLGGVLARNDAPMPQFDDKLKAQQKGFDEQSFRRPGAQGKGGAVKSANPPKTTPTPAPQKRCCWPACPHGPECVHAK